jgi:hypothetical protein
MAINSCEDLTCLFRKQKLFNLTTLMSKIPKIANLD